MTAASLAHEPPAYGTPPSQEDATTVPPAAVPDEYLVIGGYLDSHERHGIRVTARTPRDAELYARRVAPPGAPYVVCGVVQVVNGRAELVDAGRFFDQVD